MSAHAIIFEYIQKEKQHMQLLLDCSMLGFQLLVFLYIFHVANWIDVKVAGCIQLSLGLIDVELKTWFGDLTKAMIKLHFAFLLIHISRNDVKSPFCCLVMSPEPIHYVLLKYVDCKLCVHRAHNTTIENFTKIEKIANRD